LICYWVSSGLLTDDGGKVRGEGFFPPFAPSLGQKRTLQGPSLPRLTEDQSDLSAALKWRQGSLHRHRGSPCQGQCVSFFIFRGWFFSPKKGPLKWVAADFSPVKLPLS